jgi:uncharacterized protein
VSRITSIPPLGYLNLKLASNCNLRCSYCYWFRDKNVLQEPPILLEDAELALVEKLESHINKYNLREFFLLFHGGEPLLFGKSRLTKFMQRLEAIKQDTGCNFDYAITTNGSLIDKEWSQLFRIFKIIPTVSIDGPKEIHDRFRLDLGGRGSHERAVRGLEILRNDGIDPGVLAVCDVNTDPEVIVKYIVDTLGVKKLDILVPDATHEDKPPSISKYYKRLFDIWSDRPGVRIRYIESMIAGIFERTSHSEAMGYGAITSVTMSTDGTLEPQDVLRINNGIYTNINIKTHELQDITSNPLWLEAYNASLNLCDTCKSCRYHLACGGGYLAHRWSKEKRYDNVSVYCEDIKNIFGHIEDRIKSELVPITNSSSP